MIQQSTSLKYEPSSSHFCQVVVLKLRTVYIYTYIFTYIYTSVAHRRRASGRCSESLLEGTAPPPGCSTLPVRLPTCSRCVCVRVCVCVCKCVREREREREKEKERETKSERESERESESTGRHAKLASWGVHGYLAHKKPPHPSTLQLVYA